MLFGFLFLFFPAFGNICYCGDGSCRSNSPSRPSSSSSLAEGLSRQQGGITTARQDQQSTKVPSGSSAEAIPPLLPTWTSSLTLRVLRCRRDPTSRLLPHQRDSRPHCLHTARNDAEMLISRMGPSLEQQHGPMDNPKASACPQPRRSFFGHLT